MRIRVGDGISTVPMVYGKMPKHPVWIDYLEVLEYIDSRLKVISDRILDSWKPREKNA
jgi:hypothetical protein